MTLDEALEKLGNARQLIFEVEHMFDADKDDVLARNNIANNGYRARSHVGDMEHELLIRKGIRSR